MGRTGRPGRRSGRRPPPSGCRAGTATRPCGFLRGEGRNDGRRDGLGGAAAPAGARGAGAGPRGWTRRRRTGRDSPASRANEHLEHGVLREGGWHRGGRLRPWPDGRRRPAARRRRGDGPGAGPARPIRLHLAAQGRHGVLLPADTRRRRAGASAGSCLCRRAMTCRGWKLAHPQAGGGSRGRRRRRLCRSRR